MPIRPTFKGSLASLGLLLSGSLLCPAAAYAAPFEVTVVSLGERVLPGSVVQLVRRYADIARFAQQNIAPADVSADELTRLIAAAPEQIRALLATEGYFNPLIKVRKTAGGSEPASAPSVEIALDTGLVTAVSGVALELTGPITQTADWPQREAQLKSSFSLAAGSTFAQRAWTDSKNAALSQVRADRFALARLQSSAARIDADTNRAQLALTINSGPLVQFGALEIAGIASDNTAAALKFVPQTVVRNLWLAPLGAPYSQQALQDFQERLVATGLFDSATVDIQLSPEPSDGDSVTTPVLVRLREAARTKLVLGVGYSANSGQRLAAEHTGLAIFGWQATAKTTLELARKLRSVGTELSSYVLEGRKRNLLGVQLSSTELVDSTVNAQRLRVGRAQDGERIERLVYLQLDSAQVRSRAARSSASAVTANVEWLWRDVDNPVLPTRGQSLAAQVGAGVRFGDALSGRPFGRMLARGTLYRPYEAAGRRWYTQARLELGSVIAQSSDGIAQPLLFRAGGDDSVRGYDYQALGVLGASKVVTGGRLLASASVEVATPVVGNEWLAAVFVDVGSVADRARDLRSNSALGVGVGARWRSPVGPLRLDLAYAERTRRFKLHANVGAKF